MTLARDLVLIPGLGADAALYRPQVDALGERVHAINWIDPLSPDEPLESYAHRLAGRIRALPTLRRPFWIGGISFGGMLAAEIAECCATDIAGLMLIGACLDRRELSAPIRLLTAFGEHLPPGPTLALTNHLAPTVISWTQGLGPEDARLYEQVYARGSKHLLRWGFGAMRNWQSSAYPKTQVRRAHGGRDRVIPLDIEKFEPARDLVVPSGRHLINLTHAKAVNRWIARTIAGV